MRSCQVPCKKLGNDKANGRATDTRSHPIENLGKALINTNGRIAEVALANGRATDTAHAPVK